MVRAVIELNIADVDLAIREYLQRRIPDVEVTGVVVKSWNATVFEIKDGKLQEPWSHIVRTGHSVFSNDVDKPDRPG